jgi:hypothetical protein
MKDGEKAANGMLRRVWKGTDWYRSRTTQHHELTIQTFGPMRRKEINFLGFSPVLVPGLCDFVERLTRGCGNGC